MTTMSGAAGGPPAPSAVGPRSGAPNRPALILLTGHWLSLLGLGLIVTALISWLFVLPLQVRGHVENPYIGILVFLIIPLIFFAGLALVPIGITLARRRLRARLASETIDRRDALRRLAVFLAATALLNIIVGTQLTYRAVNYMESATFCGQSCHVMLPEFTGHAEGAHAGIECVACHVAPGAAGWVESKMAGTRQLIEVMLDSYPRPIPSALESNRLVPAKQTCEECHSPNLFGSVRLRVIPSFADDEANTPSYTVLNMLIGGRVLPGIHGAHVGEGIEIRYAVADDKRQSIPRVEYHNAASGEMRTYLAADTSAAQTAGLPMHTMQCVDCHNRPTHPFDLPERAVDKALASGALPATLPFIRKQGVEILKANYATPAAAAQQIPAAVADYYRQTYPDVFAARAADIAVAGRAVLALYNRNVFPDLKVTWGTYPNNLGHTDFPGCFRCHDGSHSTADGAQTITQDCTTCHVPLALSETSPEVLKTLGIDATVSALRKP